MRRRQGGFTLMEMLVAVLGRGTAVAAISGVITTSMRNVSRAEEYERVALLARSQMNELLTLPWKDGQIWNGVWAEGYRWKAIASVAPPEKGQEGMGFEL